MNSKSKKPPLLTKEAKVVIIKLGELKTEELRELKVALKYLDDNTVVHGELRLLK